MLNAEQLRQAQLLRMTTKKSFAEIAEIVCGDRSLGTKLRSTLRIHNTQIKNRILSPIKRLFDDPLILTDIPTIIIGDTHAPYQNTVLLENIFSLAELLKIPRLIHCGDIIDAASYNSQAKNQKVSPIEQDIQHAKSILYRAQSVFQEIVIMPGNHDAYYYNKEKITFAQFIKDIILEGQIHRIITTEYDYVYYADFAVIGHPSGYDPTPGMLASKLAEKYGKHVLIGHDHLQGYIKDTNGKVGVSIGGMFIHHCFWYKERALNLFPNSNIGFVIIKNREIWLYNEQLVGKKII